MGVFSRAFLGLSHRGNESSVTLVWRRENTTNWQSYKGNIDQKFSTAKENEYISNNNTQFVVSKASSTSTGSVLGQKKIIYSDSVHRLPATLSTAHKSERERISTVELNYHRLSKASYIARYRFCSSSGKTSEKKESSLDLCLSGFPSLHNCHCCCWSTGKLTTTAIMASQQGDFSEEDSLPGSPVQNANGGQEDVPEQESLDQPQQTEKRPRKSAMKKKSDAPPLPEVKRPELPEQPDPTTLDLSTLNPLTPEIIARQATINIGTIGHVAHGKSTVVKAISEVQTVRFKNELERNITIKLGYANAKVYKCDNPECPRPTCYKSYKSEKEVDPPCEREGCGGRYRLLRHVSYVSFFRSLLCERFYG